METKRMIVVMSLIAGVALAGCAAPAPTATPTTPPVAVATLTKAPTATATKRPVTKVTIAEATHPNLITLALYAAIAKGQLLEEGLDVEMVATQNGPAAVAAVLGGSAPIGLVQASEIATVVAQGQPVKTFAALSQGIPGQMLLRKEVAEARGITEKMTLQEKMQRLRGAIFAASSPGGGSDYRIRFVVRGAGLDPDRDVQIAYVGGTSPQIAAFEQGAVDVLASGVTEQTVTQMRKGNAVMLANFIGGEVPLASEVNYNVAVGRTNDFEAKPDIFEAFVRGVWRGMKSLAQSEAETLEQVRAMYYANFERDAYLDAWKLSRQSYPTEPTLTDARFKATLDYRNQTEPPPPLSVRFEDWGTNRFVEAAKKQLGF